MHFQPPGLSRDFLLSSSIRDSTFPIWTLPEKGRIQVFYQGRALTVLWLSILGLMDVRVDVLFGLKGLLKLEISRVNAEMEVTKPQHV